MSSFSQKEYYRASGAPAGDIGVQMVVMSVRAAGPMVFLAPTPLHPQQSGLPFGPLDQTQGIQKTALSFLPPNTPPSALQGVEPQLLSVSDQTDMTLLNHYVLLREASMQGAGWENCYRFLPWEDHRQGRPDMIDHIIAPALKKWASLAHRFDECDQRLLMASHCFALDGAPWDENKVADRFHMLGQAGLLNSADVGEALPYAQRGVLAEALGAVRRGIKDKPLVFDVLPTHFTLHDLQQTVEAMCGVSLHKQNFRRSLDQTGKKGLVEKTGQVSVKTGGRPAHLYKFRRAVLRECARPGVKLPLR